MKVWEIVSQLFFLSVHSFLNRVKEAPGLFSGNVYSVFIVEPTHDLLLGVKKLLINVFVGCVGYEA